MCFGPLAFCPSLFPFQLPIEDLCVLSSRSLLSPFTAAVPASMEDVLMKGFQTLQLENNRIETAQQVGVFQMHDFKSYTTVSHRHKGRPFLWNCGKCFRFS